MKSLGWMTGSIMASLIGALVVVRLIEWLFAGATGAVAGTAKAGAHVGTWTAITASLGLRDFSRRVKGLRSWMDRR